MIIYKDITLETLKNDYGNNLGFVFQSGTPSSNDAIERLCNILIQKGITTTYPEFVNRINPNTIAFVYGDDFNGPDFFKKSSMASQMGICAVDSIYNALKNIN